MDIDSGDLDLDLVASLDFFEIEDLVGLVDTGGAGLDAATCVEGETTLLLSSVAWVLLDAFASDVLALDDMFETEMLG